MHASAFDQFAFIFDIWLLHCYSYVQCTMHCDNNFCLLFAINSFCCCFCYCLFSSSTCIMICSYWTHKTHDNLYMNCSAGHSENETLPVSTYQMRFKTTCRLLSNTVEYLKMLLNMNASFTDCCWAVKSERVRKESEAVGNFSWMQSVEIGTVNMNCIWWLFNILLKLKICVIFMCDVCYM